MPANKLSLCVAMPVLLPEDVTGNTTGQPADTTALEGPLLFVQSARGVTGNLRGKLETAAEVGGPWVEVEGGAFAGAGPLTQVLALPSAAVNRLVRYTCTVGSATVCCVLVAVPKVTG